MRNIIWIIFFSVTVSFAQTPDESFSPNPVATRKQPSANSKADATVSAADELNNRAVELGLKNRHAEAVELLRKAVAIEPNSVIICRNLGSALFSLKEYDEAVKVLKQVATEEITVNAKTQVFLGEALFAVGNYEESLAAFQKALEVEPNNAVARYNYGSVLQESKQYERALKEYDRAVALDPNLAKAFNNRGMTYFLLGDYRKAAADLEKALTIDRSIAEISNNLGVVYSQLGKRKTAHKYFLEAVRLRPDFNSAQFNLALSYQESGKRDEAFKHFLRLKQLDENLAEILRKEMSKQFVVNASQNEN